MTTYDHWKSTNPADELLGPEPQHVEDDPMPEPKEHNPFNYAGPWPNEPILGPEPQERGFQLSCGCCVGPENDRCCCHMHQDIRRGLWAHKCSLHKGAERP